MLSQYRKQRKAKLTVGKAWKAFRDKGAERSVLFWSGGKDSFLTLRALQRRGEERITLLTTFDGKTGKIPFQDTKVSAPPFKLNIIVVFTSTTLRRHHAPSAAVSVFTSLCAGDTEKIGASSAAIHMAVLY